MKKLLVYLRPYRLQAILAPCFKLLEAAFELLVPLIMADIIDVGISSGDTAYILKKCLGYRTYREYSEGKSQSD